ncbi:MAG TPA: hypothetical protein VF032_01055 [Thermoleophilaceae bacterium]
MPRLALPFALLVLFALAATALAASHATRIQSKNGQDALRPFGAGGYVGFQENSVAHRNHYDVFLRAPSGQTIQVNRPGTTGEAGGIEGNTVIYSEGSHAGTTLTLYDIATGQYTPLPVTGKPAAGLHPTVSGPWVLYWGETASHRSTVQLYNIQTGENRILGTGPARDGYVYPGQVNGDHAVWGNVLHYGKRRQTDALFLTQISTGKTTALKRPRGELYEYTPAVTPQGTVFFTRQRPCSGRGCQSRVHNTQRAVNQIMVQPLGGKQRVLLTLPHGDDTGSLFAAPAPGGGTTLFFGRYPWLRNGKFYGYSSLFQVHGPA